MTHDILFNPTYNDLQKSNKSDTVGNMYDGVCGYINGVNCDAISKNINSTIDNLNDNTKNNLNGIVVHKSCTNGCEKNDHELYNNFNESSKKNMLNGNATTIIDDAIGTSIDVKLSIEEYVNKSDWRVGENANNSYSFGGLLAHMSGKISAHYWLKHVYTQQIAEAHISGDFHIHDLGMLCAYCAGWSLRTLLESGFNGVRGCTESAPPRHFSSALLQVVNFLGTLQNEWAGAQAFSSFDTYMAPFVRIDKLSYTQVKQLVQEFIYNLNVPSRWGSQTPFTNLTFDWICPEILRKQNPIIAGRDMDFTYGDLQQEMDMINKAYIEVMTAGDASGSVFTFPIPTYNITSDFDWDHPNTLSLFAMTAKYGLPYFQNFINSDLDPNMIRSMCCRLQLDLRELLKRGNGLFGSAEQTGSIGIVTINCARLGYLHKGNEQKLMSELSALMDLARTSLTLKRKFVQDLLNKGLFPYTKRYLGSFGNHFSTIGVNGINEMIRNYSDDAMDITCPDGKSMAIRLLQHVRERLMIFQETDGILYNLEATPAEGATYRFAKEDVKRYPDIIHAGCDTTPYYTNSSQLPVDFTDDPFEALDHQDELQILYTGGTVMHLYMSERMPSSEICRKFVKKILEKYRSPYITITPVFSVCEKHGYLSGEHEFCPKCDSEIIEGHRAAINVL